MRRSKSSSRSLARAPAVQMAFSVCISRPSSGITFSAVISFALTSLMTSISRSASFLRAVRLSARIQLLEDLLVAVHEDYADAVRVYVRVVGGEDIVDELVQLEPSRPRWPRRL